MKFSEGEVRNKSEGVGKEYEKLVSSGGWVGGWLFQTQEDVMSYVFHHFPWQPVLGFLHHYNLAASLRRLIKKFKKLNTGVDLFD